jgi:hypothetical protein
LVEHLKLKHNGFCKANHNREKKPTNKKKRIEREHGAITQYIVEVPDELSLEDAFLCFLVQTNQPFAIYDHPAFYAIYTFIGKTCLFKNRNIC